MVKAFIGNSPLLIGAIAFYCICGLWRLAYFNVIAAENRSYFTGLPVPGAMFLVAMSVWVVVYYNLPVWVCAVVPVIAGLLMISCIKSKKYGIGQKALWVMWLVFLTLIIIS